MSSLLGLQTLPLAIPDIAIGIKRTGKLPVTIAEFNIQEAVDHCAFFPLLSRFFQTARLTIQAHTSPLLYIDDTSNVDGFNIPMAVTNSADCPLSNCPYDLREACPDDLQWKNDKGDVVGCLTDCGAHQDNQEYCCFGAHELPENVRRCSALTHLSRY